MLTPTALPSCSCLGRQELVLLSSGPNPDYKDGDLFHSIGLAMSMSWCWFRLFPSLISLAMSGAGSGGRSIRNTTTASAYSLLNKVRRSSPRKSESPWMKGAWHTLSPVNVEITYQKCIRGMKSEAADTSSHCNESFSETQHNLTDGLRTASSLVSATSLTDNPRCVKHQDSSRQCPDPSKFAVKCRNDFGQ